MLIFKPKTVALLKCAIVGFLLVCHALGMFLKFGLDQEFVFGFVPLVDFDREGNLPTYYQTISLFVCSCLLSVIGLFSLKNTKSGKVPWFLLSLVFLFISLDEAISIHEQLIDPMREKFGLSGFLYFGWVIPYAVLMAILAAVLIRFLLRLPKKTFRLFCVAAVIYLTGAFGFELIGGYYFDLVDEELNFTYAMITTIEETLEMIGVIVFVYALLDFIETQWGALRLNAARLKTGKTE